MPWGTQEGRADREQETDPHALRVQSRPVDHRLGAGAFLPSIAVGLLAAAGQRSHDRKALPLSSGTAPSAKPLPAGA